MQVVDVGLVLLEKGLHDFMSVSIDGHIPIGIACHESHMPFTLNATYLLFFMVSLVDHHGIPLIKAMVNHGLGPFT